MPSEYYQPGVITYDSRTREHSGHTQRDLIRIEFSDCEVSPALMYKSVLLIRYKLFVEFDVELTQISPDGTETVNFENTHFGSRTINSMSWCDVLLLYEYGPSHLGKPHLMVKVSNITIKYDCSCICSDCPAIKYIKKIRRLIGATECSCLKVLESKLKENCECHCLERVAEIKSSTYMDFGAVNEIINQPYSCGGISDSDSDSD